MNISTAIAAERTELAAMLDDLSPAQWDAPSLCAGWRVREVAAHMSMGFRYRLPIWRSSSSRPAATSTGWPTGAPARTPPSCPPPS